MNHFRESVDENEKGVIGRGVRRIGIDEDVVKVCDSEFVEVFMNDVIDVSLERARSITQSKRHDQVFKVVIACAERGFRFVPFRYSESIKSFTDIKLSKELGASKAI